MRVTRNRVVAAAFLGALAVLFVTQGLFERAATVQAASAAKAPKFEVDPFWPKPLPNHWLLGSTIGVWVDASDNVWIIHRSSATLNRNEKGAEGSDPIAECCKGAPPVLAFDKAGNLIQSWGGPGQGFEWPESNHGIFVDHKGNVWIGGNGPGDSHVLKFTKDGKFLAQYGKQNARRTAPAAGQTPAQYKRNSNDPESFGRVAKIFVEPKANEAYLADGYFNTRVAVLDGDTGKMKRYWGAYGNKPTDEDLGPYRPDAPPAQQFRNPVHCADVSNDGLVYVCDRQNNRIQVFTKEGKFVKEGFYSKNTLAAGAVWDVAFSRDAQQRYIYAADGQNAKVYIIERDSLQLLTTFGDGGRQPGQFFGVHSVATDSQGNLYTTETYEGKRVQKFVNRGIRPVPSPSQGSTGSWPASK
jgi:DNA-binding beta-propeller fold protein YncE